MHCGPASVGIVQVAEEIAAVYRARRSRDRGASPRAVGIAAVRVMEVSGTTVEAWRRKQPEMLNFLLFLASVIYSSLLIVFFSF